MFIAERLLRKNRSETDQVTSKATTQHLIKEYVLTGSGRSYGCIWASTFLKEKLGYSARGRDVTAALRTLDPELDPVQLIERESYELVLTEAEAQLEPARLFSNLYAQIGTLTQLPRRIGQIADHLEAGTLKVGVVPANLEDAEHMLRSVANRVGAALIVVGLLISSALMARVNHVVSLVGFCLSAVIGLYMIWRIIRTPGEL